ncbi:zinc ribbon domain-containing protein [Trichothermofontia sp.]
MHKLSTRSVSPTETLREGDFRTVSRWEPARQVGSEWGYRWGKLDLSVHEVVCMNCGTHHDRDEKAAVNIQPVGAGHVHDAQWTGMAHRTGSLASPVEPLTRLIAVQFSSLAS